jgi:spore photoproduct lyase
MQSNFSHIYYEKEALDYPLAGGVLKKFPKASLIEIADHRDLFNRKRQDWRLQKKSLKLILAKRKSEFLYPGSDVTPDFNHRNFYYNTLVMNCIYDCHYCYLQGMYPSANIVMFTNIEDYFEKTDSMLKEKENAYLSISYDTDLLAFENIAPYCKQWINYAAARQNLILELRTKSSNYAAIKEIPPASNFILAWTLSPDEIVKKYETNTPSLKARLSAASKALEDGWNVRICIDPIIMVEGWKDIYKGLIEIIRQNLPLEKIYDISLGTFRMNSEYFQRTRNMRSDSELLHFPFTKKGKMTGYEEKSRQLALGSIKENLLNYLPQDKLFTI